MPAKTPRQANSACSSGDSREKLQSRVFCRVRCRSGRSRGPPVRTPIGLPSRASSAWGGSSLTRAAASSMASGKPSSRRQISATAPTFWPVSLNLGATAWARSVNSRTEAYCPAVPASRAAPAGGTGSGGTGNSCSPLSLSMVRLVTRIFRPGAVASSSASSGAASVTCSKLSSTSSSRLRRYDTRSARSLSPEVFSPSPAAIAPGTRSADGTDASSMNRTPSAKPSRSRPAASTASRVFPEPPGPVRVTSRTPSPRTRASTAAISCSRPTSGVGGTGSSPAVGTASPGVSLPAGWVRVNRSLSSTARSFSTRRCRPAASVKRW